MVREMIGGCCVCLDERGWNENPLVYCDGNGCTIAVHQACYGIVKVPSGPWYCCKCRSQERVARVKCELCPKKDGALKKTDNGGWAHVVCALYIPEVRFGDVSTMEPIIFSSVPNDRFSKVCYICEEENRESGKVQGACMSCHKNGCKLSFHVTCAQSKRQLCEEASVNGHVQYVGYCTSHWQKRLKAQGAVHHAIPLSSETESKKMIKEKKSSRMRNESTSSNHSVEIKTSNRGRKPKMQPEPQIENTVDNFNTSHSSLSTSKDFSDDEHGKKDFVQNGHVKGTKTSKLNSFQVTGTLSPDDEKSVNSPLNTPLQNGLSSKENSTNMPGRKRLKNTIEDSFEEESEEEMITKKKKFVNKDKNKVKDKDSGKNNLNREKKKKEKYTEGERKKREKTSEKKKKFPRPSQLGLLENGKVSSWDMPHHKINDTPDNFQSFLEHQWNQSAQFITSKAQHFDVASLLCCLHQLKSDNSKLEKKLSNLQLRKDRLLGLNARLESSFTESSISTHGELAKKTPLSAMLSKLNESCTMSSPSQKINTKLEETITTKKKRTKKRKFEENVTSADTVASPDLAMLAATSLKHDNRLSTLKYLQPDEKQSGSLPNFPSVPGGASLLQPDVGRTISSLSSIPTSTNSLLNGFLSDINTTHDKDGSP